MRTIVALLFLSVAFGINAQNFQGKAVYKTHRKLDIKLGKGKGAPNSAIQKQLMAQLKKQFQKTFILNFTKSESTYKQDAELSKPQVQSGGMQIRIMDSGGSDVLYKNIAEKRYVNQTEISGKRFLIKDQLKDLGWEMTGETKNIGNYTCYKATRSREEERTSFAMTDGKQEEKKETVTVTTVAWYTPQIPVSNGPDDYWGLPGLILEIQEGKLTIACSEIVLNPSNKVAIKEPKRGKKVTQAKFDKIMTEHSKDMMERFKNGRKSKNGNSFSIQIQG